MKKDIERLSELSDQKQALENLLHDLKQMYLKGVNITASLEINSYVKKLHNSSEYIEVDEELFTNLVIKQLEIVNKEYRKHFTTMGRHVFGEGQQMTMKGFDEDDLH